MMSATVSSVAANEDAELVKASLAGNREAFGQIVTRYQSLVCSLAYSATGNLSQSEDLAQETFFAAWKQLSSLREPAKIRSWLCGIARNLINNFLRSQGREPSNHAESLEAIVEPRSVEPLPVERAINREEAEILWRSLERIPETYREPLVLFYRNHQSIEAVARDLELTEEAVRQRLSRGRKLLEEEVQAFVENALKRTRPGTKFTVAVVAGLPFTVASAEAASVGVAVAKGGAGAKSAGFLAVLGSLGAMLAAVIFSWKTAVDETKSPAERRLMVRTGWFQIAFFVLSMVASYYLLPRLSEHPLVFGVGIAFLLLANIINGVVLLDFLGRRRVEFMMEEGTWADAEWSGSGKEMDRKALRKAGKLMIPIVLMFVVGSVGLPWKEHWIRSVLVVVVEGWVVFWGFRRFYRMQSGRLIPGNEFSRLPVSLRHPIILLPAVLFGSALFGVGLVLFMNPGATNAVIHQSPFVRNIVISLLAAMLAYAVFAIAYMKKRRIDLRSEAALDQFEPLRPAAFGENILKRILGAPFMHTIQSLTAKYMGPMVSKMMVKAYAPVLEQLDLSQDQRAHLQELILKKSAVNMDKGSALLNAKLDATRRAALIAEMKDAREGCDAEIREFLGPNNYQRFEQFEKSLPDRMILDTFKVKLARSGSALTEEQYTQMLLAISVAREQSCWSTDLSRRIQNPADLVEAFSEENIAIFAQEEKNFDRQFLISAQAILTARQLVEFEPFLEKQRASKIASMRMTSKMFVPEST